ncbi:HNH endonuclease signature motif containing protein [Microlunatus antarcticus]|uniref:DUF222 domain-containing protein n=1 Tax=Microlunatus antarcticus TaxID=53388 RepID=A0A7W5P546_9ACTN|nr:HNH endonuclease signature motif containing protein [Microlunatus antarcticus]MBB3325085.1 hypothetical protein [Microlunatus antarcticus]
MFDPTVTVATASQLADRIAATHALLRETECEELVLAAAWADVHYLDAGADDYRPLVQRARAWGGDGCPQVAEHCAHELGALRGTGSVAARMLIADALDLRHRLPRLWVLVTTGVVRAWQARAVAQATHALSWEACAEVDQTLSGFLPMLAWPRFQRLLTAAVLEADPDARRAREEAARVERGVWSYAGEDGLRTIVAKAASGDVRWFMAAVERVAEVLRLNGDLDPVDARRAKAVGILADPARALALLLEHADDGDPRGQEPPEAEEPAEAGNHEPGQRDRSFDLTARGISGADLRRARSRVVLHLHLTDGALRAGDGLVRPEHGDPLTLDQAREWLADTGCHVTVRPVVDPVETAPVDAYEIPYRLRDALFLRNPVDVFPFGQATSRTLDLDHTVPYVPLARGGPPGQTSVDNLGPLTRSHHRAVTFGGWRRRQPDAGTYVFRSPNGHVFVVTNQGTLNLGRTAFTDALWAQCRGEPNARSAPSRYSAPVIHPKSAVLTK